jgi:hypothetical protein
MTTELAVLALYRALRERLTNNPSSLWGVRAYGTRADDKAERPYVVYTIAAERQGDLPNESNSVIDVVCVAESVEESMIGAGVIDELINNMGVQDRDTPIPLVTGSVWTCYSITREELIHMPITTESKVDLYITGAKYRVNMQR